MNPTFETMSIQELRAYVLSHREDVSAFHVLIDRTQSPEPRTQYPCPNTPEKIEITRQALREKLGRHSL
jgi:hypothetical protein